MVKIPLEGKCRSKSKITCVDGVDEQTQNHHFCQSPFLTKRRTLDRHYNEVD